MQIPPAQHFTNEVMRFKFLLQSHPLAALPPPSHEAYHSGQRRQRRHYPGFRGTEKNWLKLFGSYCAVQALGVQNTEFSPSDGISCEEGVWKALASSQGIVGIRREMAGKAKGVPIGVQVRGTKGSL